MREKGEPTRNAFFCKIFKRIKKPNKTKKASSKEEAFVPGAGVEPARFPTGV